MKKRKYPEKFLYDKIPVLIALFIISYFLMVASVSAWQYIDDTPHEYISLSIMILSVFHLGIWIMLRGISKMPVNEKTRKYAALSITILSPAITLVIAFVSFSIVSLAF
mgnify:CR=1 FL=1